MPVLCALAACSSGGSAPATSTTTASSASKTPQITVASDGPLAAALLTTDDLRAIEGLPADAAVVALGDLSVYVDPDPRGPCGAKVPVLDLTSGAGVGLQSASVQGVELVARSDAKTASEYLDARVADAHAGCPEYETTTNRGEVQKVKLDRIITLHLDVDQSLATQRAILVGDKVTSVTVIELRRGAVVAKLGIFAGTPLTAATVRGVAARVAERLAQVR
jgi:hypothetical protein